MFLVEPIIKAIIIEVYEGPIRGHFLATITLYKILNALFWQPMLRQDVNEYCKKCDICQKSMTKKNKYKNPLHPILLLEIF